MLFWGVSAATAVLALVLTWRRLFVGMDVDDESFSVLVPWRWALGDRPFVNEENLAQAPALVMYPFVKVFAVVTGHEVTGLVLYGRHLYLLLMIGVAVAVFVLARRLVRAELALLVAVAVACYIHRATPQLSHDTIALAMLTLSLVFGMRAVLGGGRSWAVASGAALGVGVVGYPTLLFIAPFWAVLLSFAHGRRATGMIAEGAFMHPPDPEGPPTGRPTWRNLSAWVAGAVIVLVPAATVVLSFGPRNLWRGWQWTMAGARELQQMGGADKAIAVATGFWRFMTAQPLMLVAALGVYLLYRRWPRLGRALLAVLPAGLWLAAQQPRVWSAGYVVVYAFLAPYLFLFLPAARRHMGAQLLIWVWAPSVIAGAMTAYTSANGSISAAVGLAPGAVASAVFFVWALEAAALSGAASGEGRAGDATLGGGDSVRSPGITWGSWLALAALVAVVGVTLSFHFQFQQRDVPLRELTSRFDSGPWWGIKVTPERRRLMDRFAADLAAQGRPGDQLLIFDKGAGYYLYWDGAIAANTYRLKLGRDGSLPQATVSYYRRHRLAPTLAVRLGSTHGVSDAELQTACGGLGYPPTLVRPRYAFFRTPPGETTAEVLARLPRRDSR